MNPSLIAAIMNDDVLSVKKLLDADVALVNAPGHGERPIHVAAANNRAQIVKELILRGADINATDDDGKTPLLRASELAVDSVKELLENKADLNVVDKWGCSPLAMAYAGQTLEGEKIAQMLLQHGATFDLSAAAAAGDLQAARTTIDNDPESPKKVRSAERLLGLVVSTELYGTSEDRAQIATILLENGLNLDKESLERMAEFAEASGNQLIATAIRTHIGNITA